MKEGDTKMGMMEDKHEARIKEVLTPTQYDGWMKWCTAQTMPAKDMEKMDKMEKK